MDRPQDRMGPHLKRDPRTRMNQVETAIRCSIVPETPMPSCYTAQSQVFVKYSMWPWLVLQVEWPKKNNATSSEANMVERNSYQRPLFPAKRPPPTFGSRTRTTVTQQEPTSLRTQTTLSLRNSQGHTEKGYFPESPQWASNCPVKQLRCCIETNEGLL